MATDDTADSLPVPTASARAYFRLRPTTDTLDSETVATHLRRLHRLKPATGEGSLLTRLRGNRPPTIEVLLISRGGDDTAVEYYLGVHGAADAAFARTLRGLFPDSYEFTAVQQTAGWLRGIAGTDSTVTGVEFHGLSDRPKDWQTKLTPFETFLTDEHARIPLAAVVETMAASSSPMVYQALLRPKADWSRAAESRRVSIESQQDTLGGQVTGALFGAPEDPEATLSAGDRQRLEELEEKDARRTFECTARVVAFDDDSGAVDEFTAAFTDVSYTSYEVGSTLRRGKQAEALFDAICERRFSTRTGPLPPLRSPHPLVVDATEAANFCILDGDALTVAGNRSLAPTPGESRALPTPPAELLKEYRGSGLSLGLPLNDDGAVDTQPVVLPPNLQPMHVGWFGKTGSGKSMAIINAILANHAATDGADILIDPKGDGMAQEYLRAHYATYGHLENVLYFDCANILPAFAFFDIRDELEAGVPRATAVEDTVDHYVEILSQIMGRDRFEQAVRSPDIIRYLLKATFDPVNGSDSFSHREFHNTVRRMHERQAAPAVADDDLERMLAGVVANRARSFDEIMQGVANRIEKIPIDQRLARIFNHCPEEGDPHFDLAEYLNEDVVIILDTGELRSEAQRVLTLVILSNLWTALRRRSTGGQGSQPLVNLYIEEAASIAVSDLLKQLLSQSRSFDCSVTLAMQFPAQMRRHDQEVYEELLNNISTIVTGNVAVDRLLTHRFATEDMDLAEVGNRLRALRRGQWLVSLPAGFDETEPRPFLVRSLPLPAGDPEGERPLSLTDETVFDAAVQSVEKRTEAEAGLTLGEPSTVAKPTATDAVDTEIEEDDKVVEEIPTARVDSALPYTMRLPETVEYDGEIHALRCRRCDNRYDPSIDGLLRAIECCGSLDEVDPDDIPICDLNLKLTPEERAFSEWSDGQLMFLQAVYNAQQLRYEPPEYDLLQDSMIRLQEYVGIDTDAVQYLLEADLLRHDTDHPHRLYSVTPDGRKAIGESYRRGVDFGHGQGDLEESSQHVFAVETGRRFLEQEYLENPDSRVAEVVPYYDLDENHRLDLVGLDSDGEFVVTLEVERINHDIGKAVLDDFDKMAGCDPEEAIWLVMTQSAGHDVLEALNNPSEGPVRIEKTYARTTPPQQFQIDTPGLTAIYPIEWLRDNVL